MSHPTEWLTEDAPSPAILKAIGAIILAHTVGEAALLALLSQFLAIPPDPFRRIFVALNNREKVDLVRSLGTAEKRPKVERDAITFALRAFDICGENRNIVAHSHFRRREDTRFRFIKFPTSPGAYGWEWAATEKDLESAHHDAVRMASYLITLSAKIEGALGPDRPFPDRPPQPRKLSLLRLPEGHSIAAPLPES
jgi:hypothetical protein